MLSVFVVASDCLSLSKKFLVIFYEGNIFPLLFLQQSLSKILLISKNFATVVVANSNNTFLISFYLFFSTKRGFFLYYSSFLLVILQKIFVFFSPIIENLLYDCCQDFSLRNRLNRCILS